MSTDSREAGALPRRGMGALVLALLAAAPGSARGAMRLLDRDLSAPLVEGSAASPEQNEKPEQETAKEPPPLQPPSPVPGSLEFDLLGAAPLPTPVDEGALRTRRTMLTAHQGAGLGLLALQLATTLVGQLNYSDRFAGGPSTARYQLTHEILAYSTLAAFTGTGLLALLAPAPLEKHEGFDRVTLHKIAMFTATAGMATEGILGVVTRSREGYLNQQGLATTHLVIGYVTLAAVLTGVGALVF